MKIRHAVNVGEIAAKSDFSLLLDTYAQKAFKMEKKDWQTSSWQKRLGYLSIKGNYGDLSGRY